MSNLTGSLELSTEILSTPIEVLNLSTRAYNALKRQGISSLGEVMTLGENGVFLIYQIGPKQLNNIFDSVAQYLGTSREALENRSLPSPASAEDNLVSEVVAELPVSVLKLSRRVENALDQAGIGSIDDLLQARAQEGLVEIRGIGREAVSEIEDALTLFLETANSLTDRELEQLRDPRPTLITVDLISNPNLVKLVVPFAKALMEVLTSERGFEVLRRRYGLDISRVYTLQEIGDYYDGISRQRVEQIERKAKQRIRDALLGSFELAQWQIPGNVIQETGSLLNTLEMKGSLLLEEEILQIIEDRYDDFTRSSEELNAFRFLLVVLGFSPFGTKTPGELPRIPGFSGKCFPAWEIVDDLDKSMLYQAIKSTHRTLLAEVRPLSFFDLKSKVNRRRKKTIETAYIQYAIRVCAEIEHADPDSYQIKLGYLPSLANQAYRILYEMDEPIDIRDLFREINHRLVKTGFRTKDRLRSLQQQLVADSRFEPVGHSGIWSLSEWKHVRRETVLKLMQEFFHLKQSKAEPKEIYEYVRSRRESVSMSSIYAYLTMNRELFTRVSKSEYELSVWGGKAYKPLESKRRLKSHELQEHLEAEIKAIFAEQETTTLALSQLVRELVERTGIPTSTVYSRLGQSPLIETEPDPSYLPQLRAKIARYKGAVHLTTASEPQKTIREIVQAEIKSYLRKQRNRQNRVLDVRTHVMKTTGCKSGTFYRYLAELEEAGDVRKVHDDHNRLCCFMEVESTKLPSGEGLDTKAIRDLLTAAFDDSSLMTLCFDRFHALYDEKLSRGMGKGEKIQSLLDYCLRQGQLGELLEFVKEHNPHQYSLHRERIFHSM